MRHDGGLGNDGGLTVLPEEATQRSGPLARSLGVDSGLITFRNHYRFGQNERGDHIAFPELVAAFEQETSTLEPERVPAHSLAALDDFLLLVSFMARQRCICLGWEVADSERVTKYYRRDFVIPPVKKDHSFNDTLVHPSHFDKFIDIAYPQFLEFTLQDFLRQVLWKVTADIVPVEERILTLFSALETMVSWFREKFQFSKILTDDNQWASFSKDLKDWIKKEKASYFPQREMRGYLYDKIPELNRISVTRAFNKLCTHYAVDLHDLWPVFGEKEGISLSSIRNKLIHGVPLDPLKSKGLLGACLHLQWTVERLLLAVLSWPLTESRIDIGAMGFYGEKAWRDDQQLLSRAFHGAYEEP